MLKKAGIVVAIATAGLLAVNPFCFASDNDRHGIINPNDTDGQTPVQACNNSVVEGTLGIMMSGDMSSGPNGGCQQDNTAPN